MATQGPLSPGTAANQDFTSTPWSDVNNIKVADGSYATVTLDQQVSDFLVGKNFGFSIPVGATIDGIVFENKKKSDQTGSINDDSVFLTKDGTNTAGINHASATQWPASPAYESYGSSSDLWGATWTISEINSANFGIMVAAVENGVNVDVAYADHFRITVHYTTASSGKLFRIATLSGLQGGGPLCVDPLGY